MKKLIPCIILALIFALPMTVVSSSVMANTWYRVNNSGKHVDVFSKTNFEGKLSCRIPHGEILHAEHRRLYQDGFVFVYWKKKFGVLEWHWKDAHGKWCPIWDRHGWVDLRWLRKVDKPDGLWIN